MDIGTLTGSITLEDALTQVLTRIDDVMKRFGETTTAATHKAAEGFSMAAFKGTFLGNILADTALKAVSFGKDLVTGSIAAGARLEQLAGVSVYLGERAGYTAAEVNKEAAAIEKSGITGVETRNAIIQLEKAHVDLSKASQLSALAQNMGVLSGRGSSETFGMMIRAITTTNSELIRSAGFTTTMTKVLADYTRETGKNGEALGLRAKQQLLVNAMLKEGAEYQGVYTLSMNYSSKILASAERAWAQVSEQIGLVLTPVIEQGARAWYEFGQKVRDIVRDSGPELKGFVTDVAGRLQSIIVTLAQVGTAAVSTGGSLIRGWKEVPQIFKTGAVYVTEAYLAFRLLNSELTAMIAKQIWLFFHGLTTRVGLATLAVKDLWATMLAHPLVAVTAAIGGATLALTAWYEAKNKNKLKAEEFAAGQQVIDKALKSGMVITAEMTTREQIFAAAQEHNIRLLPKRARADIDAAAAAAAAKKAVDDQRRALEALNESMEPFFIKVAKLKNTIFEVVEPAKVATQAFQELTKTFGTVAEKADFTAERLKDGWKIIARGPEATQPFIVELTELGNKYTNVGESAKGMNRAVLDGHATFEAFMNQFESINRSSAGLTQAMKDRIRLHGEETVAIQRANEKYLESKGVTLDTIDVMQRQGLGLKQIAYMYGVLPENMQLYNDKLLAARDRERELANLRMESAGTPMQKQIKAVQDWAQSVTEAAKKAKTDTKAFYDWLAEMTGEKMKRIQTDMEFLLKNSIAHRATMLQEELGKYELTLATVLSKPWEYAPGTTETIREKIQEIKDKLIEVRTAGVEAGGGITTIKTAAEDAKPPVDALAASAGNIAPKVDAIKPAADNAAQGVTNIGTAADKTNQKLDKVVKTAEKLNKYGQFLLPGQKEGESDTDWTNRTGMSAFGLQGGPQYTPKTQPLTDVDFKNTAAVNSLMGALTTRINNWVSPPDPFKGIEITQTNVGMWMAAQREIERARRQHLDDIAQLEYLQKRVQEVGQVTDQAVTQVATLTATVASAVGSGVMTKVKGIAGSVDNARAEWDRLNEEQGRMFVEGGGFQSEAILSDPRYQAILARMAALNPSGTAGYWGEDSKGNAMLSYGDPYNVPSARATGPVITNNFYGMTMDQAADRVSRILMSKLLRNRQLPDLR